jgi:hypothetical protein
VEPIRVNLAAKENTYRVAAKNLYTLRGHLLDRFYSEYLEACPNVPSEITG